jgi:two-component system, OmpR family, sensor histidine kinase KdpD
MFLPFQRLGDTGTSTSTGVGLTVSRGLTEAMRGTVKPEDTAGGGLTMGHLGARGTRSYSSPVSPGARERAGTGWPGAGPRLPRAPEHGTVLTCPSLARC